MYIASIFPDRITVRFDFSKNVRNMGYSQSEKLIEKYHKKKNKQVSINSLLNLKKKKSNLNMSVLAKKNIRDSCNMIYSLSPKRNVRVNDKLTIFNFKASFITLTLPSKQVHTDIEIKECMNNFLQSLRVMEGLSNYVWKAELQKNENIHFHVITDIFINHNDLKRYWNKAINKLGYVDRYSEKMRILSYDQYCALRGDRSTNVLKAFNNGIKKEWREPNSVDIKSVITANQMSFYLSKYMFKDNKELIDSKRIENFGRVWARSRSISVIKIIKSWDFESIRCYLGKRLEDKNNFFKRVNEWNTTYYVNFKTADKFLVSWINSIIHGLGVSYGYPFIVVD